MTERQSIYWILPIERIASDIGATPSDIPGLWNLAGFPELTSNQLREVVEMDAHGPLRLHQIAATLIVGPP